MNKEEIEKRIEACEQRASAYREVGNSKTADKYEDEKWKWEQLLYQLNPKRDKELQEYKKGYNNLKDTIKRAREFINSINGGRVCSEFNSYIDTLLSILGDKDEC